MSLVVVDVNIFVSVGDYLVVGTRYGTAKVTHITPYVSLFFALWNFPLQQLLIRLDRGRKEDPQINKYPATCRLLNLAHHSNL